MERLDLEYLFGLRAMSKSGLDGRLHVLKFCMTVGLIGSEYECPKCGECMKLTERADVSDGFGWVCRTRRPLTLCEKVC